MKEREQSLMQKLVLIDGNGIAYRAFFALPLLNNDKGVYTNAVYGFTMMLQKIIEDEQPTHIAVAFDAGKTTFRHDTYEAYKSGRQKTPHELSEQFPLIRELLDAYHISRLELENYEADDIIGTIAKKAEAQGWQVKIYSGDKDLLQLVTENIKVVLTRKGITNVDTYGVSEIQEKYGFEPIRIIDMKGLMGDSSDNIPGVPGVGEKTALKLLHQFGSLEKIYTSLDQVSGKKLKEKLEEYKEQAFMSKQLATIFCEVPITISWDDLQFGNFNKERVIEFYKELEFHSLLEKMTSDNEHAVVTKPLDFTIVSEITEDMLASPSALVAEVIDENYHQADLIGFSLVNEKGHFYFSTQTAQNSEVFKNWAKDCTQKKWVFDGKKAAVALAWKGISLEGINFDVLIASYLIDPSLSSHELADITKRNGGQTVEYDEVVYGKGAKRKIPDEEVVAQHLVQKAAAIFSLKQPLEEALVKNQQAELFRELELPLATILGKMERNGVKVDTKILNEIGEDLKEKIEVLEQEIYALAGTTFNINSPKQLGEILFTKMGLPVIKKTKTGFSTSADVLEKLKDHHEIVEKILHYRQLGKLQSTYIEGLLKVVHKDTSKIHTIFNQALTQTGRLSSTEPNLQNIPIRIEEGRKIRKAFVPSCEDWFIVAADYSQIELRVLAHMANDEKLIAAFHEDMDIHTKTAMDVFHVSAEEVTSNMRRAAKAVNFGIVYGISDYGLSQNLNITRKEAAEFIERYFKSFPGVKEYMNRIVEQAREEGYVTTLLNRRRYLPDITSRNYNLRSFAERTAMNTPIQGSAADIIKKAMVDIANKMQQKNLKSRLLLQVHDELIFEVPEEELEEMKKLIKTVMESAVSLKVPLKVECAVGQNWYDAK